MATAVKKTISLPAELAEEAETTARAEGKTLSAVIQGCLVQRSLAASRACCMSIRLTSSFSAAPCCEANGGIAASASRPSKPFSNRASSSSTRLLTTLLARRSTLQS